MQEMPKSTRSVIQISLYKSAVFLSVMLAVILLDQLTKWWVVHTMALNESISLIDGVFRFTYILNEGAAFGMLADNRWIFLIFSTLAIGAIGVCMVLFSGKLSWAYGCCFSMIVGGGVGNMIDRIFNGEQLGKGAVIDFLDFCAFPQVWSWIFNVADSFVCIGAVLFFILVIRDEIKERRKSHVNVQNTGADPNRDTVSAANEPEKEAPADNEGGQPEEETDRNDHL